MQIEGSFVPAHYGIRTEKYKLIRFYGRGLGKKGSTEGWETPQSWELYDLEKDPYEMNNVYDHPDYQSVIEDLTSQLYELMAYYGDSEV
jgi:hypothetical protein